MDVPLCAEVSPLKMYLVKTAVQMVYRCAFRVKCCHWQ